MTYIVSPELVKTLEEIRDEMKNINKHLEKIDKDLHDIYTAFP